MGNGRCRHRQQATESACFPAVLVKQNDFKIDDSEPLRFECPADRGHAKRQGLCATCGSPLFLINGASDGEIVFFASSMAEPSLYTSSRNIFVKNAQPWDVMDPALPRFAAKP
ncbi:GFA family protein [Tateyamaria sp.]|uniref:GFA family protein n=1 Tax=Roseobacteraceae TaxID=2854170 RepID=UPI0039B998D1